MSDLSKIKQLRAITGVGVSLCSKALNQSGGDVQEAVKVIRSQAGVSVSKKSGRATDEGAVCVAISQDGKSGAIVEVKSETDFVARNDIFHELLRSIAEVALQHGVDTVDKLLDCKYTDGITVNQKIAEKIAEIGENINLSKVSSIRIPNGVIGKYIHNELSDNIGSIATMVALSCDGQISEEDTNELRELANNLSMHVAATQPVSISVEDLSEEYIKTQREVFTNQALSVANGKTQSVIDKIVDGKLAKSYKEDVLLMQDYVADNSIGVQKLLQELSNKIGKEVGISDFVRIKLGENSH